MRSGDNWFNWVATPRPPDGVVAGTGEGFVFEQIQREFGIGKSWRCIRIGSAEELLCNRLWFSFDSVGSIGSVCDRWPSFSPEHSVHGLYGEISQIDLGEVVSLDLVNESFSRHVDGKRSVRCQGQVKRVPRI